jgi:hypothetical protein
VDFLVINSQLYVDSADAKSYATEQDKWLARELSESKRSANYAVMFSHVPPFVSTPDEDDGWANIPSKQRQRLLQRAKKAGVKAWFCGHYHQNAGGWDEELEVVVTAAVGTVFDSQGRNTNGPKPNFSVVKQMLADPAHSGLRIVQVDEDGLSHQFHSLDSVPPQTQAQSKI